MIANLNSERDMEHSLTGRESLQKEKLHKIWNLSIWNKLDQTMVREIDATWNPIYDSILVIYQKLEALDFKSQISGDSFLSSQRQRESPYRHPGGEN